MLALPPPDPKTMDTVWDPAVAAGDRTVLIRHGSFWVDHPTLGRVEAGVWTDADTPWGEVCKVGRSALEFKVARLLEERNAHGSP